MLGCGMKQERRHLSVPAFSSGSGGGIRTPDLWVMSPTSCRCSTPRRVLVLGSRLLPSHDSPTASGVGGARGGLASRGVAPTVLSGAALGHDRVRDGTGWGQHALGHGHPPPPSAGGRDPLLLRHDRGRGTAPPRSCLLAHAPCIATSPDTSLDTSRKILCAREGRRCRDEVVRPPPGTGRPDAAPRHRNGSGLQ